MTAEKRSRFKWLRWMPLIMSLAVFSGHALFIRQQAALPSDGWADVGVGYGGLWGFEAYVKEQDFYLGFSYALGTAFAVWAAGQFINTRQTAMAAGAVGSATFVGVLMAAGCFLAGCCGSPMLGVYLGLFGAKALGIGKPLMALVTVISVGCGHWHLSRRAAKGVCTSESCNCSKPVL
jgi:hypothetical protein